MQAANDSMTGMERPDGGIATSGFPRWALFSAGAAAVLAIVAAAVLKPDPAVTAMPQGTPLATRDIAFQDRADGSVAVLDPQGVQQPIVLEPGTNAFIRATMRGLARERRLNAMGPDAAPFRLSAWPNGRMTLQDMATGRQVDIVAFGPTQVEAFARLLPAGAATR